MTYEQTVKELIKRGIEKPQEIMQEVVDHMRSVKIGKEIQTGMRFQKACT